MISLTKITFTQDLDVYCEKLSEEIRNVSKNIFNHVDILYKTEENRYTINNNKSALHHTCGFCKFRNYCEFLLLRKIRQSCKQ